MRRSHRFSHSRKAAAGKALEEAIPFSNWDISQYIGSGSSDMIVDGAL